MVSAGLDTVPANILQGLAYLSSEPGQAIQAKAYKAIQDAYPDGTAWTQVLKEEKIPYITAFYKEVLRYYTVINMCLPRQSIKDINYQGAIIPAGTIMMQNSFSADFDEDRFPNPFQFNPERYLEDEKIEGGTALPHYAYGAGSRECAGKHLANRELFTAFTRLICTFKIKPSDEMPAEIDPLRYNAYPTALVAEPKDFLCYLEPRNEMVTFLQELKAQKTQVS